MEVPTSDLGKRLVEAGKQRDELFKITNRLAQSPGDLGHIRQYVNFLLEAIDESKPAEALEHYDRIEAFLLDRAANVDAADVEDLLAIVSTLDERRRTVAEEAEENVQESEADRETVETLEKWGERGVESTVPESLPEAQSKLQRCRDVRNLARLRNVEEPEGLESLTRRLQSAIETDKLLNQAESLIQAAAAEEHPAEAAYVLQSAEQTVQKLVMKRFEVGDARTEKVESVVRSLEDASQTISRRRRTKQDQQRWEDFKEHHRGTLDFARDLDPENVTGSFTALQLGGGEVKTPGEKTKRDPKDNQLTQAIDDLQQLLQQLNQTAAETQTEELTSTVSEHAEMIESKLDVLRQRREQMYNEFALARLERAFEKAEDAMKGIGTDTEGIADALIEYVAEIDQRYLTSEVGQSYSEVFQHLYSELDDVKSSDDFDNKETKLGTLKRMREKEAMDLRSF
jgi:hypothetical protein